MRLFILVFIICIPGWVSASVRISEVAWMGTAISADDEWIELFNDGSSVSLEGWTLSDDANLNITLSGQLATGAYAVLERTNDDSAPGAAFLIYSGALPNSGGTLTLRNGSGSVVDTAAGGSSWEGIGGNNTTKETAQRTSSGWTTAAATPGSGSLTSSANNTNTESTNTTSTNTTKNSSSAGGSVAKPVVRPPKTTTSEHNLTTTIIAPEVAYLHQSVTLVASSTGLGKVALNSLQYTWNFGDGETGSSPKAQHTYSYPGFYVVVVESSFKEERAMDRVALEVRSVPVSLVRAGDTVYIRNDATYEVDISGYTLSGRKSYIFPPHSYVVIDGQVTLPTKKVAASPTDVIGLFDRAGNVVASTAPIKPIVVASLPLAQYRPLATNIDPAKVTEQPVALVDPASMLSSYQPLGLGSVLGIASTVVESDRPTEEANPTALPASDNSSRSLVSYAGLAGTIALGLISALTFGL